MAEMIRKAYAAKGGMTIDENARTAVFCISAETLDRDSEVLVAKGCDYKNYLENPVVLFAHNGQDWPVAKTVEINIDGQRVWAKAHFPQIEGDNDLAQMVESAWAAVKAGLLRGASVGFMPTEVSTRKCADGQQGSTYEKWELHEWSLVPVPCNPQALVKMLASGAPETLVKAAVPDAYAALRQDKAAYSKARLASDIKRLRQASESVRNGLKHIATQAPSCDDEAVAERVKAYFVNVAVRDTDLVDALRIVQDMGRVMGATFIPDETLEWMIFEDVDGDGADAFAADEDGNVRQMPGRAANDSPSDSLGSEENEPGERQIHATQTKAAQSDAPAEASEGDPQATDGALSDDDATRLAELLEANSKALEALTQRLCRREELRRASIGGNPNG